MAGENKFLGIDGFDQDIGGDTLREGGYQVTTQDLELYMSQDGQFPSQTKQYNTIDEVSEATHKNTGLNSKVNSKH